ncbi:MAG: M23 family metallopeptidase [Zetaproteobacteria bacterium]|nr:MAG: M23 family metallopeptidase [Zetaproteobacteria bacterium]
MKWAHAACTLLIVIAGQAPLSASEISTEQGGLAVLEARIEAESPPTLQCLGKSWPVERVKEKYWKGWVGVDLATPAGQYICQWLASGITLPQNIKVTKGHFRISRIQVPKRMAEFDSQILERIQREVKALKRTYRLDVEASPSIEMKHMPVEGPESTPFGARRIVNGQPRSPHTGIDIAAPEGTPVIAPLAGRVLYVGNMYLNGKTVVIGHGRGLVSVLSHMADILVSTNQWVKTGELVGHVGQTGRATGPHLHWSVRFHEARINPHALLATAQP